MHNITVRFLLIFVSVIFFSAVAVDAQATRTWVSGVGDDVNPCSRTAPCKTFAGAISKTAIAGEINCLDPGGFGALTITKSITVDCTGTVGSTLASLTTGFIINAPAGTVRLRGLMINGASTGINGIRIMAAAKVSIENIAIDGFTQSGIWVGNTGDTKVVINNVTIRNNTLTGVSATLPLTATADILVSNSLLTGNGTGIFSGPRVVIRISGNRITHNAIGLSSSEKGKIVSFKNNLIDGNVENGAPTETVDFK